MIQAGLGYSNVWGDHSRLPPQCDEPWVMSEKVKDQQPEHETKQQTEDGDVDDPELKAIKMRVREMEEETERLKGISAKDIAAPPKAEDRPKAPKPINSMAGENWDRTCLPAGSLTLPLSAEEKKEADQRSVYVGNVDYGSTAKDLESHFSGCGLINRITILCDRFSGHPKGYAYIEFAERSSVEAAIALDETVFRERTIKVLAKRTNLPGISSTDRGGFRGRSRGQRGNVQRGQRARGRPYRSWKERATE